MANYRLQILHASDHEAGLAALDRAANFAAIIDRLEDLEANSITLSSGDGWIPSPFFAAGGDPALNPTYNAIYNQLFGVMSYNALSASAGRADITIHNIVGTQAAVFGNHEFDAGTTEVSNIIRNIFANPAGPAGDGWVGAQFPYLSANLNFYGDAALAPLFRGVASQAVLDQYFAGVTGAQVAAIQEWTAFRSGPTESTASATGAVRKIAPATIITEGGERIGVVGATTQIVETISSTGGVDVIDPESNDMDALAAILQPTVDALRALGVNKIVLLSHLQQNALEKSLASKLSGVDVIVAGGSHEIFADATDVLRPGDSVRAGNTYPFSATGRDGAPVLVVNTGSEYSYVGRLVVEFDANGVILPASLDAAVNGAYVTTAETVANLWQGAGDPFASGAKGDLVRDLIEGVNAGAVDGVREVILGQDGNLFGRTAVYLEGRRGEVRTEETNFGNLTADANLWAAKQVNGQVMVSIKNGGGIRDSIGALDNSGGAQGGQALERPPAANAAANKAEGQVSQLDIANSLRFNNTLTVIDLTAQQLLDAIENGLRPFAPGATPGSFPQVGGMRFSFDATRPAGDRVINLALVDEAGRVVDFVARNGDVVGDASRVIKAVTLNFLANGGDNIFRTGGVTTGAVFAANPVALSDPNAARTGAATFAANFSEQDAFAEYMRAFFSANPFNQADTTPLNDTRIQNIPARSSNGDTVPTLGATLRGDANANDIFGGETNDSISGENGADRLDGRQGSDTIAAGAGDDTVTGGLGADMLFGDDGADSLFGFDGADTIEGGAGADVIWGQAGADFLSGGESADVVIGEAGDDVLHGNQDNDALFGGDGRDLLAGMEGADLLVGETGDDQIFGDAGDDAIFGGAGADSLVGGAGRDTFFVFDGDSRAGAADSVLDFFVGGGGFAGDVIHLAGVDANVTTAGDQAFRFVGTQSGPSGVGTLQVGIVQGVGVFVFGYTDADANADLVINVGPAGFFMTEANFIL
jgi:2',3'-cyclic-nucleotide 2'-phosphodiesterase (5'-nucleotidase family)